MEATFPDHPGELGLVSILRRWIQGDAEPWIHEADVYSDNPMSLTAKHLQATAENGDPAWYFVSIPRKKEGNDARMSRVAGSGTWKQDRSKPLSKHSLQVGWGSKFSFVMKTNIKDERDTRVGWIMNSVSLLDGEDPFGRCLHKIYRTPRSKKNKVANPQMPLMSTAASGTLVCKPQTEKSASSQGEKSSGPQEEKSSTHQAEKSATHLAEKSATTPEKTASSQAEKSSSPLAEKSATPSEKTSSSQAEKSSSPRATGDGSPPKKWVQVLISGFPTKARDLSSAKRVFGVLLPEEDAAAPPAKKMKLFDCKGWLTIEPAK